MTTPQPITVLHLEDQTYIRRTVDAIVTSLMDGIYHGTGVPAEFEALAQTLPQENTVYLMDNNVKPYGEQLVRMVNLLRQQGIPAQRLLGFTSDTKTIEALIAPVRILEKPAGVDELKIAIMQAAGLVSQEPDNSPQ